MPERVYIRPSGPEKVVNYECSSKTVPVAGTYVTWGPWWIRRLRDGDIVIGEAPKPVVETELTQAIAPIPVKKGKGKGKPKEG